MKKLFALAAICLVGILIATNFIGENTTSPTSTEEQTVSSAITENTESQPTKVDTQEPSEPKTAPKPKVEEPVQEVEKPTSTTNKLAAPTTNLSFVEGSHYKTLALEPSKKPVVTEYFSFFCPHCNSFEPIIQQLKSQLPEGAKFQKNHVSFMGGSMGMSMSKAYATMVALKVEDKMTPVLFNRIHNMRKAPKNDEELRQIFLDEGIDAKKFDSAFNGFAVDSMVRRFDKQFQNSGLTGVPAVIVNNKYLVQAQGIETIEQYIELVNFLLEK